MKKYITLSDEESSALHGIAARCRVNLKKIRDTGGMFQVDDARDRLTNAVTDELESIIGAAQWNLEGYEILRSIALKLWGIQRDEATKHIRACSHPPTDILLKMWLLDGPQLSIMQRAGLRALSVD